jgi:hypothetical protein
MPKKDFSQIALDVVRQATGEAPKVTPPAKTARQLNSAKGGVKGGAKRMADLSDAERTELAAKAAKARWGKA